MYVNQWHIPYLEKCHLTCKIVHFSCTIVLDERGFNGQPKPLHPRVVLVQIFEDVTEETLFPIFLLIWRYYCFLLPPSLFENIGEETLFATSFSERKSRSLCWKCPVSYSTLLAEYLLEYLFILQHSLGFSRISLLVPKRSSRLGQVWLFLPLLILHCWNNLIYRPSPTRSRCWWKPISRDWDYWPELVG